MDWQNNPKILSDKFFSILKVSTNTVYEFKGKNFQSLYIIFIIPISAALVSMKLSYGQEYNITDKASEVTLDTIISYLAVV